MAAALDLIAYESALARARALENARPKDDELIGAAASLFMAEIRALDDKSASSPAFLICKSIGGHSIGLVAESGGLLPAVDDMTRALVFKVLVQVAIDYYSKKVAALAAAAASPK
jgi:predicted alpha/beta hydrolase